MQDHGLGGERFLFLCKVVQHAFDFRAIHFWVVMLISYPCCRCIVWDCDSCLAMELLGKLIGHPPRCTFQRFDSGGFT